MNGVCKNLNEEILRLWNKKIDEKGVESSNFEIVNLNTLNNLTKLIQIITGKEPGSDNPDKIFQLFIPTTLGINFINPVSDKKKKSQKGGSFFCYRNDTPIDLSRYQIFNTIKKKDFINNCFVYALEQQGLEKEQVDYLRKIIKTRHFTKSKIQIICNELNIRIHITLKDKTDKTVVKQYEPINNDKTIIKEFRLYLSNNHYMINDNIMYSQFYLRNYKTLDEQYKNNNRRFLIKLIRPNGKN